MTSPAYKRVLLKLSGEALMGEDAYGINRATIERMVADVSEVAKLGIEVAIVIGGGNIFRGVAPGAQGMDRATADYMGMLATVMNALALQDKLETLGVDTRVQSAVTINQVCEPFIRRRAMRHLEKGRVVILAAGTGNPYFTTDTAAGLRAMELEANVLLKATRVDGVYTADPEKDANATKFDTISFSDVLKHRYSVMDMTAFTLCQENKMPIIIFNMNKPGSLIRLAEGQTVGTLVS